MNGDILSANSFWFAQWVGSFSGNWYCMKLLSEWRFDWHTHRFVLTKKNLFEENCGNSDCLNVKFYIIQIQNVW